MGTVAVIGDQARIRGFALVGALTLAAEDPAAVRDAWRALPDGVEVVILTAAADRALPDRDRLAIPPLVAVMSPQDPP
jgi:vacuolar-type H+-ATPase subunit F/Vma7